MISEMAKLGNVSRQTLIYYDKIGVFTPQEVDFETGYRYYTLEQAMELGVILSLKELGMSLKQIKEYVTDKSTAERIQLLEEKQRQLLKKIEQLQVHYHLLQRTLGTFKESFAIEDHGVGVKELPELFVVTEDVLSPFDEFQLETAINRLYQGTRTQKNIKNYNLIVQLELTATGSNKFLFKAAAIETTGAAEQSIPAGTFAYIYHKGPFSTISESQDRLLAFIEDNGYTPLNNLCYERVLLEGLVVTSQEDYLTEILMPITLA